MPPKKSTGPPRVYLLWGQEEIRKAEALESLIAGLVPEADRSLDVEYLDGAGPGATGEGILNAARDRGMFSERRVVVVKNAQRMRGPKHQRTQDVLAEGLRTLPDYSTLILVSGAEDQDERKGKAPFLEKLMTAIKAAGESRQFAMLKSDELAQLAIKEASLWSKKLHPKLAVLLVERAGPDSLNVLQETRKVAAYAGEADAITEKEINLLVPARPDENVWQMLDATFTGNQKRALELLTNLQDSGTEPWALMGLLSRSLRQLAQAKLLQCYRIPPSAEADSLPPEVLAQLPGDNNLYRSSKPWTREKNLWPQAQRIGWEQLQTALDRLTTTEAGLKGWEQGVADPRLAMELFVCGVCESVRGSAR